MTLTQINKAGLDEIALDHVFTIGASGSSAYTFQGEGLNGTVNNPTLYLTRGKTYRFENGSGGHPIRIQSTSGASGTAYNTGVTNNAGSGTVIVEVQHDAPDVLYYQCTSHAAMNGILYITGALADGGVTTAKIADDAVTTAKIADNNVTEAKLALNAVTNNRVANGSITNAKIGNGAIDTAKLADQAVTLAKLEHGTSSNDGKFLRANNGADPTFETVNTDLVSDTSPQLGGDLDVNGNVISFGDSSSASDDRLKFGASNDLVMYHDGTNNYISTSNGYLFIVGDGANSVHIKPLYNEESIIAKPNNAVELYYDNSKKFSTINAGAYVTGDLGVGDASNPSHSYDQGIHVHANGTGAVLHLTDNTSGSGANDGFDIISHNGTAYLWQRESYSIVFATSGASKWEINATGHLLPNANNTYDIGSSSKRVRNLYTNDLHLSNEGSSNDVDSTWGDWTIQEGESDLFLKNNRSGKKYKFNLTEVS